MLLNVRIGMIVLTGTGRSGTSFMTLVLKEVYGIGMSSEPKNILILCKFLSKLDLDRPKNFEKALDVCIESKVFTYLQTKYKIKSINKNDLSEYIFIRDVNGIITGMFKYVAALRNTPYPGYKDPLDIINMLEIQSYVPKARFIIMVRKAEDVASSTLSFDWGPTNIIAGAWNWRKRISKAVQDIEYLKKDSYLILKLEDIEDNFDNFCTSLDNFIYRSIGISNLALLKQNLIHYSRPRKNYNMHSNLVYRISARMNNKLGYSKRSESNEIITFLMSVPYIAIDFPVRVYNTILRKFK